VGGAKLAVAATVCEEKKRKIKIGPPWLTKYERARIISARALQITLGAPVLIDVPSGMHDPIEIAELELKEGVLPIIIRRRLPVSGKYQDIPLSWLLAC